MAYWSSTNFDQYAKHDLWNVKPRWQELAEISSSFPSATTPPSSRFKAHMAPTPDHIDGQPRYLTRRTRQLDRNDTVTRSGASHSRSRSRLVGPWMRASRNPSTSRQRSKSFLSRTYQLTPSKQAVFLSLLALINILLSWFGFGFFPYWSRNIVGSVVGRVWMPHDEILNADLRHNLCQMPLVPRGLHCGEPTGTDTISRHQSIRHAIPGIAFALSENPDAVDGILDTLEDMKKEFATMQEDTSFQFKRENRKETISSLLNSTIDIENRILKWDANKELLLDGIHHDLSTVAFKENWETAFGKKSVIAMFPNKAEFSKAVTVTLADIAMVLDDLLKNLETVEESWGILLERTSALVDPKERVVDNKKYGQISRFLLWCIPFTNTKPSNLQRQTDLQRHQHFLTKIQDSEPQLKAIHTSIHKAHVLAVISRALIESWTNSWLARVESLIRILGGPDTFQKDLMDGVRETAQMTLMLLEQKVQRTDRKYQRPLLRAEAEDTMA